jgi:sialate O-acetylesterase
MNIKSTFVILGVCTLAASVRAEVKPNALFSDNAVLQQGANIPVWGTAKEGENVTVTFDGQTETAVAKDGKWNVYLKPHKAGGPFTMTIAGENAIVINNVLVGEVWVCSGQSNMAFDFLGASTALVERPRADYPKIRMFKVRSSGAFTPQADLLGNWEECSPKTVDGFSAVGYFFARDLHKAKGFPVGMIHSSVGGTAAELWTSLSGLQKEPSLHGYVDTFSLALKNYQGGAEKYAQEQDDYQARLTKWSATEGKAYGAALNAWKAANKANEAEGKPAAPMPTPAVPKPKPPVDPVGKKPTVLFNGKIAPLIPYAIKGVIWYQGESNNQKPFEYRTLFPRLIADWREKWGQGDFPFLFVQIAPYKFDIPELREAQFLTWKKTANTAMAVTVDVGDAENIHPRQKEPVGQRLALAARALAYGEKIEYSGPEYEAVKFQGNRAILTFKHVGDGLVAKDGPLKGFTIAGADQKFVAAKAEIQGDTVVVSADQVSSPVAVRYGFVNVPDGNLWNQAGLPASTFRTDPESLTQDAPATKKLIATPAKPEASNEN